MSSPEAQPVKRRPGRPRKSPLPAAPVVSEPEAEPEIVAEPDPAAKALDEPNQKASEPSKAQFPGDERIGTQVDPAWKHISFSDDRQYRIEDGVIVERVR